MNRQVISNNQASKHSTTQKKTPNKKQKQNKNMARIIVPKFNIYQFVYHLSYFLSSDMHMALYSQEALSP